MSKIVKKLLTETYADRFAELAEAMIVDIRGIDANDNNELRTDLANKQIRVTVIKNSLARKTFEGSDLEALNDLIDGPTALVYSGPDVSVVNIAREMIDWAKKLKQLELKGAVLEGTAYGPDQIEALSKFPTREEAQAQVVQLILSPAQRLVGAITGPGAQLASILKAIEEKLEDGEAIEKVA